MIKHSKHHIHLLPIYIALCITGVLVVLLSSKQTNTIPQPTSTPVVDSTIPQRATLEGTVVCLPHRDASGPQTLECAMGLQVNEDTYYAIDANLMSQIPPQYDTGDRIKANGLVTPIENLSSDHWQKYNVKGIFSITDTLELIN